MRFADITGQKFGRLTAISHQGADKHRAALWLCRCDCGAEIITTGNSLRTGKAKSCGCAQREAASKTMSEVNASGKRVTDGHLIHGENKTRLHRIWCNMRRRCSDQKHDHYDRYGGRGIKVCDAWQSSYVAFRDWALANGYADHLTIERIDNDGNYEPGNCCWASQKEQVSNRRNSVLITLDGETKPLKEWCEERGINYKAAHAKYKKGVPPEEFLALTYIETRLRDDG